MNKKFDSASPYIASFMIMRRGNLVAMLKRKNTNWMDGYFGLPAGKVEWGETFSDAAIREGLEESGVKIDQQNVVFRHAAHRHSEDTDWVDVYFDALSWDGEPYNAEIEKGDCLEWVDPRDESIKIVPSQRAALQEIANGNYYSEYGWDNSKIPIS